jgi:hypothetical protein
VTVKALLAPAGQRYSYYISCIIFLVRYYSASILSGCAYHARTAVCYAVLATYQRGAIPSQFSVIDGRYEQLIIMKLMHVC